VAYSEDGRRIISGGNDNAVRIWDLEKTPQDEGFVRVLRGMAAGSLPASSPAKAALPSRAATTSGSSTGTWRQYAEFRTLAGHTDAVLSAAFSPNGRQAVTASRDHTARLWNLEEGSSPCWRKDTTTWR